MADAEARAEVEATVATTLAAGPQPTDFPCCGNFGRFELLLEAGLALNRPDLISTARDRAAQRLTATAAGFAWPVGGDADNPGFFQGIAGIGYQLLRHCEPERLPSVLRWD